MKLINPFFKKRKKILINDILKLIKLNNKFKIKNCAVSDIKILDEAKSNDISFIHSNNYINLLKKTKASFVVTSKNYLKFVPKTSTPFVVDNVLVTVSKITNLFYPNSIYDKFDDNIKLLKKNNSFKNLKFGKNVLIGSNVKIGKDCSIGHNTIIESNVILGNDCKIGSNVIIRKTVIGNSVNILDGAVIGKKGFGFFPEKSKNIRYPHVGIVVIGNNVEIGCNNTIDRGSLSNTIIGDNTFLDNQVHIAHNVKIGKNCIITGQVGFAGSSSIGNNVMIGGQAGISGHIKIGNNVQIGGGSGVIKSIPDNNKVMGYPAKDIRTFIKQEKNND